MEGRFGAPQDGGAAARGLVGAEDRLLEGSLASLAAVTEPGATLFVLCFREGAPETEGPHPISEAELRTAFGPAAGWRLADLEESQIEVVLDVGQFPAWLVTVTRV